MNPAILFLLEEEEEEGNVNTRQILRRLRDASDPFEMADALFEENFRLPKEACRSLLSELHVFDKQPTTLPFSVRFFTAIYFFANGSYQKCVGNSYVVPMSQASVSRTISYVAALLNKYKANAITFPTTNIKQLALKTRFYSKFGMKGTIGAIDCTHISIICPPKNDPSKPCSLYMNRKGTYSMNVEVVCDDSLNILAVNANFPGSVHDSGIWTTSKVRSYMRTQHDTWLLGDKGYPLEPWLMTPLQTPNTRQEIKYNKIHCSARNVVERCFGVLKARFRCLSKERILYYAPEKVVLIVNACTILHNILMEIYPDVTDIVTDENEEVNNEVGRVAEPSEFRRQGERIRQTLINNM